MRTKIKAAKIAANSGVVMVIADGALDGVVREITCGRNVGTVFIPKENRLHRRKRWIAFGARIKGTVIVDAGCAQAIEQEGSSLLPTGVKGVEGEFNRAAAVRVVTETGREIARGVTNYSAEDVRAIMGKHTPEIAQILGSKTQDEIIHRDNLVVWM